MLPVEYHEVESRIVEDPVATEPAPETPAERETPMIQPIPVYPAYIVEGSTLWGVPSSLQGPIHRERIEILLNDDTPPTGTVTFFTLAGYLYISIESVAESGPIIDRYRQRFGNLEVEVVDEIPPVPAEARVVLDSPAWLVETSTINGVEWSYIYNRATVFGEKPPTAKGHFVCLREKVTAFVVLDNGLLWQSEHGAEFCNAARKGASVVCEGRLWK